jgi:tetratricopeptide (TPR) repeat protein
MDDMIAAESDGDDSGGGRERAAWPPADKPAALTGEMANISKLLRGKQLDAALARARAWHEKEPGNVLALIALGDVLEAKGGVATAARVYGSIIDLFPGRADMRRFAGERLARLNAAPARRVRGEHQDESARVRALIIDTYRRAVADRPDHMTGHRLLAYALVRAGKHADAFAAILAGIDREYRSDSYAGGERVLREDAQMIGAAYAAAEPTKRGEIEKALGKHDLKIATRSSTRFILYWETDANDVDFHIQDSRGGHAFYSDKTLASGGELYADITTGYGPECFAIPGTPKAGPYRLSIDYYSQGPMGFGMGLLEVQRFDGKGGLSFEDRPYVIMNDHAYVDLGTVK